jgi:type I restriction enzyme S subunit
MAIYKPYPKYKNSNIPWLGEIPEHWEITKLKYLITLQKGKVPKEFSNKENNLPYLSK